MKKVVLHRLATTKKALDACRLVEALYLEGKKVLVAFTDAGRAATFNEYLWTFSQGSFVPHSLWDGQGEADDPVVLALGTLGKPNGATVLVVVDPLPDLGGRRRLRGDPRLRDPSPRGPGEGGPLGLHGLRGAARAVADSPAHPGERTRRGERPACARLWAGAHTTFSPTPSAPTAPPRYPVPRSNDGSAGCQAGGADQGLEHEADASERLGRDVLGRVGDAVPVGIVEVDDVHRRDAALQERRVVVPDRVAGLGSRRCRRARASVAVFQITRERP